MREKATLQITGPCDVRESGKPWSDSGFPVSSRDGTTQTSDEAFAFASSELTARVVDSGRREEKNGVGGGLCYLRYGGQVISTAGAAITGAQAMRRIARWLAALPMGVRSVAPRTSVGLAGCCTIGVAICTSVLPREGWSPIL